LATGADVFAATGAGTGVLVAGAAVGVDTAAGLATETDAEGLSAGAAVADVGSSRALPAALP
jgi:hypothetical protein